MKALKDIEGKAREQYKSFRQFIIQNGHSPNNFKRKLINNLEKINKWIEPLGLEIRVKNKEL